MEDVCGGACAATAAPASTRRLKDMELVYRGNLAELDARLTDELGSMGKRAVLTTYMKALAVGDLELIQALDNKRLMDVELPFSIATPLQQMARVGPLSAVQKMLTLGQNFSGPGNTPDEADLAFAAESGNLELLQYMVEKCGLEPNCRSSRSSSILLAACGSGSFECVEYLVSRGVELREDGRHSQTHSRCMQTACKEGGIRMVKDLLRAGWVLDGAAVAAAASSGDVALLDFMIGQGADVNAIAKHSQYTALSTLFLLPPPNLMEMLDAMLDRGAVARPVPGNRAPPLLLAHGAPLEAVERLLDAGADINHVDPRTGETALFHFTKWKRLDLVQALVRRGADFESCDSEGISPFMWAATMADEPMMLFFLRNGADVDRLDSAGRSWTDRLNGKTELTASIMKERHYLRWRRLPLLSRLRM